LSSETPDLWRAPSPLGFEPQQSALSDRQAASRSQPRLAVLRGGGDIATGVAWRLVHAGFALVVLELPEPLTVRRTVALSSAVRMGNVDIEGLRGTLFTDARQATEAAQLAAANGRAEVPVLICPSLAEFTESARKPHIVVDARLAKRNLDSTTNDGDMVIGLGPGFTAGVDVHAVVESNRGHHLGRVFWTGSAEPNTGIAALVGGRGTERVLRALSNGSVTWQTSIGDQVLEGQLLGIMSDGAPLHAPFTGVLRGLIAESVAVTAGLKIGDIDPKCEPSACFEISDKALAIGGGVVEAALLGLRNLEHR
jgi:xanthine dehydrogenase accessory factor